MLALVDAPEAGPEGGDPDGLLWLGPEAPPVGDPDGLLWLGPEAPPVGDPDGLLWLEPPCPVPDPWAAFLLTEPV